MALSICLHSHLQGCTREVAGVSRGAWASSAEGQVALGALIESWMFNFEQGI